MEQIKGKLEEGWWEVSKRSAKEAKLWSTGNNDKNFY